MNMFLAKESTMCTETTSIRDGLGIDNLVVKSTELYDKQVDKAESRVLGSVKVKTNILKDIFVLFMHNPAGYQTQCRFKFALNGETFEKKFSFEDEEEFIENLKGEIYQIIAGKILYEAQKTTPAFWRTISGKPMEMKEN